MFMYLMILSLVAVGYLLEGMRITGAGMPAQESVWSPVGWIMANVVLSFNINDELLATIYRATWMFRRRGSSRNQ